MKKLLVSFGLFGALLVAGTLAPAPIQAAVVDSIVDSSINDPTRTTLYDITKILINIIQIGLLLAGGVAATYIVVSGYQYIIAAGNPEKLEKAKMGLTWAIGGFIIAISSFAIVLLLETVLRTKPDVRVDQFQGAGSGISEIGGRTGLLADVFNLLLAFAGAIAVLLLIIGGYRYMTSQGNEQMVESAKKTVTYSVIGLAVVFLAFVIVALVGQLVKIR